MKRAFPGLALVVSPSPLNGERVGVRGERHELIWICEGFEPDHPSPSIPLPVEGRGKHRHAIPRLLRHS